MSIKIKSAPTFAIQNNGVSIASDVDVLNFSGLTATVSGAGRVTISGSGGGGGSSGPSLSVTTVNASGGSSLSYDSVIGLLTYTPPDLSSYLTSITSQQVTNALGYTPYNSSNPSGYTSNAGTVVSVQGAGSVNGITLTGTVTNSGSLTLGGTLSNIANSQLANSTISGISLGQNLASLTIGVGLTGTSYNGGTAVTIANAGVTSVVAGTGITVSAATGDVTISMNSNPTFVSTTSSTLVTNQIIEPFQTYSTAISGTPTVTLNCSGGNIWRITSTASSTWTAALTNVAVSTGRAVNVTLLITQGATAYVPNAVSVNGTAVSILWQGGALPGGSANKTDAVAFSIMQTGASTYVVLGQLVSFG